MNDAEFFLLLVLFGGGFFLLLPVARALSERIRGRAALDPAEREESRRFRAEVAEELDLLRREVAELHERVDFTERLLAQERGQALPKGH
jgi:hypothetical protein